MGCDGTHTERLLLSAPHKLHSWNLIIKHYYNFIKHNLMVAMVHLFFHSAMVLWMKQPSPLLSQVKTWKSLKLDFFIFLFLEMPYCLSFWLSNLIRNTTYILLYMLTEQNNHNILLHALVDEPIVSNVAPCDFISAFSLMEISEVFTRGSREHYKHILSHPRC